MSRKKVKKTIWGNILKQMREEAGLNQSEIGWAVGMSKDSDPKGNISDIENGMLPISEKLIREWVSKCGKSMVEFYIRAAAEEEKRNHMDNKETYLIVSSTVSMPTYVNEPSEAHDYKPRNDKND